MFTEPMRRYRAIIAESRFRMSGKPTVRSYVHGTESKTSIQPITARKIIAQPIRMLRHGMVTAQHEPYRNYLTLIRKRL